MVCGVVSGVAAQVRSCLFLSQGFKKRKKGKRALRVCQTNVLTLVDWLAAILSKRVVVQGETGLLLLLLVVDVILVPQFLGAVVGRFPGVECTGSIPEPTHRGLDRWRWVV